MGAHLDHLALRSGSVRRYSGRQQCGEEKIEQMAANHYEKLEKKVSDCILCGHCDRRCPFHMNQSGRMKEIAACFGKINYIG
ncbi:MAG TPA: 4Fe-4S dicluster domain-containing protein [Candidatus Eisenbergiella intestinipullorum]|nr:4Fe-4S dicluster domain-containing protein [Candidatus Eisenbergiella intestinipullorum]